VAGETSMPGCFGALRLRVPHLFLSLERGARLRWGEEVVDEGIGIALLGKVVCNQLKRARAGPALAGNLRNRPPRFIRYRLPPPLRRQ
jgi:hypothetical protein